MPPADPASLVPRDIPLPLPADLMWLQVLIVILFLVHIVFVNLLVGSTLLMLRFELRSLWFGDSTSRKVARAIGQTTTVTKSLAVVFGVAPLLLINVIYTVYFYTANALTGDFWMSIVAWATAAFLLLYLHKYSWDWSVMRARPWLHWATGAAAAAILLFIPLIFLTNINLMLFPDEWPKVKGFWSALWLPNVFPRYLHFLMASLAASSLFLAWYFRFSGIPAAKDFAPHRSELTRSFYNVAFQVSLLQFLIGPLVLITLPQVGLSIQLLVEIGLGATLAVGALYSLWRELRSTDDEIGGKFWTIVGLLWGTVLFMAHGRHLYREEALSAHRERVAAATRKFMNESEYAAATQNDAINKLPADQKAFTTRCSVCHAVDRVLAAPSVMEVAQLYKGNPKAIVAWAKAPGKKRAQFKGMPSMAHVPEDELFLIAEYMLRVGASPEAAAGAKTGSVSAGPAPEATAP